MNATRKVKLKDISSNLACNLCKGYIIDATTTIECLHSFCKSCIVKHLENSEFCPVCGVQLHSTKPLSGIRSDQMLQEIIYKLVPGLFGREMDRRRQFYKEHPESSPPTQMDSGQVYNQLYITSDDKINISLEYFTEDVKFRGSDKRYFNCPAEVSVSILKKLVQGKYDVHNEAQIDIMYGERILPDDFLLMDIAYKYSWTDSGTKPLQLRYRVKCLPSTGISSAKPISSSKLTASKRRSRSFTDSEILKSSNRNLLVDVDNNIKTPTTPKLTPNGKLRGRRKRSSVLNEKNETKQKKLTKSICTTTSYKEMESQSDNSNLKMPITPTSNEKEVQLQISENGIISARSMTSGEERIIGNLEKSPKVGENFAQPIQPNLTEKSVVKGGCGTANGMGSNSPATTLNSSPLEINGVNLKPNYNYVKLNIPTINVATVPINGSTNSCILSKAGKPTNANRSPNHKISTLHTKKKSPTKRKAVETGSHKMSNGIEGSKTFESKKANVQKALMDLQKKHFPTISEPNTKKSGTTAQLSSVKANTYTSTNQSALNGLNSHTLPFPLSALASSGMTVNLIPSSDLKSNGPLTGKNGTITNPSTNKFHQTTVVNGDLKFTTNRHILPSPSKSTGSSAELSPKKPPKFFKSRHASPVLSSDGESPLKQEKKVSKESVVSSPTLLNGQNGYFDSKLIHSTSSKSNTTTTPSCITTPSNTVLKSSPFLSNPFSQFMNIWNPLQLNLALQANNLSTNLVPFVTNEYISMPFTNQCRSMPMYGMNMAPSNSPFPLTLQNLTHPSLTQANVTSSGRTASTSVSTKNGSPHISSTLYSTKNNPDRTPNTLNLSMNKKGSPVLTNNGSQHEPLSLKVQVASSPPSTSESKHLPNGKSASSSVSLNNGKQAALTDGESVASPVSDTKAINGDGEINYKEEIRENKQTDVKEKCEESSADELQNSRSENLNPDSINGPEPESIETEFKSLAQVEDESRILAQNGRCTPSPSIGSDSGELLINEDATDTEKVADSSTPSPENVENETQVIQETCKESLANGTEDKLFPEENNLFKNSTVCNNNNNPPADLSIPHKLSSTTGA